MMLSPSACCTIHARGQQTAQDWIVMHGGGRRAQQYAAAYRRNRRAARFPSIHVCGAELINSACMYLHGALLERRAVRVACCLTTMFLREQHTALLCCGLRLRRREPKARCALYCQTLLLGRGRHLADFAHNSKEISRQSTPHTCKYSLARRSLTYLPSICPPPVHTLAGCGCLLIARRARACHCLHPPVFISARINHAY
jgi:hypothetical protein